MSEVKEDKVFPFIEGENVSLCPVNMDHIHLYAKWMNDRQLRKYNPRYNMPQTIEEVKKLFEPKEEPVKNEIFFEIWNNKEKKPIGFVGLIRIEWLTRNAHLFYLIEPNYWGQNNGTEVGNMVVEYSFKELNLHKITLRVFAPNKASLRVAEKIGFTHEITLKKEVYIDGEHIDALEYSIFKEDWMKLQ